LALLQYAVGTNSTPAVVEKVQRGIEAAFRQGATYVVLPESSFIGVHRYLRAHEVSTELQDCDIIPRLRPLARRYDGYIVFNHIFLKDDQVFNTSVVLGPSGELEHIHRKTVLAVMDEHPRLSAGDRFEVVETRHGRIGIMICREAASFLAQLRPKTAQTDRTTNGVDLAGEAFRAFDGTDLLVLQLAHAGLYDQDVRDAYVQDRLWSGPSRHVELAAGWAGLTGAYVVLANKSGHERGYMYSGHSCAVAPDGRLMASAGYASGMLFIDLPLDAKGRIDRSAEPAFNGMRTAVPLPPARRRL
jgi:predicted amidohydrolase